MLLLQVEVVLMTEKARNSRTHCHRAVPVWTNVGRVTAYWEIAANLVYSMFSMYRYLIVKLAFSHLSFWIGIYFVSDCATSYINALGLAISEKIFLLFLFKAIGTNDPRDRAFFTPNGRIYVVLFITLLNTKHTRFGS